MVRKVKIGNWNLPFYHLTGKVRYAFLQPEFGKEKINWDWNKCIKIGGFSIFLIGIGILIFDNFSCGKWEYHYPPSNCINALFFRILLDKGADLLAVNNEGEIPSDLAEEEEMDEFLEEEMEKLGQ